MKEQPHDDVIKWKHFPRYWPFVRRIHPSHRWIPLTKAADAELWCFFDLYLEKNGWVNNREAGDLRRRRANYDVIVMKSVKLLGDFVTKNNKHLSESR